MNYQNFVEVVRYQAENFADKNAYHFLHDAGRSLREETISYSELDSASRNIAANLQKYNCFNQRVLMLYPSGLEFIKAFLGCLYAGAIAVPAPLPTKRGQQLNRVFGIINNANVVAVITSKDFIDNIKTWLDEENLSHIPCFATDDLLLNLSSSWVEPKIGPDHLAFFQYTSGSTSEPKGVMVSHKNLLANEKLIEYGFGLSPTSIAGGWLPFYHDMGLIGNGLNPLYTGYPMVLMTPMTFLKRPARWLQMISDYQVTCSGGPNFAYDLCTQRITDEQIANLDLSSWKVAFNGSEPVKMETLKAFSDRFGPAGFNPDAFYPCYGMAETTLFVSSFRKHKSVSIITADASLLEKNQVSVLPSNSERKTCSLVSSGEAKDFNVAIVDPETKQRLAENQIGEIWVNGDSVAQGYWELPEITSAIFNAKISGENDLEYLRTGDLGFLNNGELFITGRIKEMIIINGRNLYPHDIEDEVQTVHPALIRRGGAAFSVDSLGLEELVIVQEVKSQMLPDLELKEIAFELKQKIGHFFEVPVHNIVLIKQSSLNKTTSGKIQRKLTKNLFLERKLSVLYQDIRANY
jgi:acyl-CoA synthetase (AMP-forming)/AMP-acid ligase II